jgi:protein-disulfide isomerase
VRESRLELVAAVARAVSIGDGQVKVTVFTDMECPFCAQFHSKIDSLQQRLPRPVTINYIHFPLSIHKFANQAAAAAECAAGQDGFRSYLDVVFASQDSIGLLTWSTFAQRAGIKDMERFEDCMSSPPSKLIKYGIQAGERLGVTGTPTVFINDFRFSRPPTVEQLHSSVMHAQEGKPLAELKFAIR